MSYSAGKLCYKRRKFWLPSGADIPLHLITGELSQIPWKGLSGFKASRQMGLEKD